MASNDAVPAAALRLVLHEPVRAALRIAALEAALAALDPHSPLLPPTAAVQAAAGAGGGGRRDKIQEVVADKPEHEVVALDDDDDDRVAAAAAAGVDSGGHRDGAAAARGAEEAGTGDGTAVTPVRRRRARRRLDFSDESDGSGNARDGSASPAGSMDGRVSASVGALASGKRTYHPPLPQTRVRGDDGGGGGGGGSGVSLPTDGGDGLIGSPRAVRARRLGDGAQSRNLTGRSTAAAGTDRGAAVAEVAEVAVFDGATHGVIAGKGEGRSGTRPKPTRRAGRRRLVRVASDGDEGSEGNDGENVAQLPVEEVRNQGAHVQVVQGGCDARWKLADKPVARRRVCVGTDEEDGENGARRQDVVARRMPARRVRAPGSAGADKGEEDDGAQVRRVLRSNRAPTVPVAGVGGGEDASSSDSGLDSDAAAPSPSKRRRTTPRASPRAAVRRPARMKTAPSRGDGSDSSSLGNFLVDSDEISESESSSLGRASGEEGDADDAGGNGARRRRQTVHPPEHMFASPSTLGGRQRGPSSSILSNKHAFVLYLEAIIVSSLDATFREDLMSSGVGVEDDEIRRQLAQYRGAITRVEQDLLKSRAKEFIHDGRWREIENELDQRPFFTHCSGALCITPQPVNLQNKMVTYCNGCNYREGTRFYHAPTDTVVLSGPRINEPGASAHWPKSIVAVAGGELSFPNDMVNKGVNIVELEKRTRVARMRQWREHHPNAPSLPREELVRARNECTNPADWGRSDCEEDGEDGEDGEDDDDDEPGSVDGENDAEPTGFGMQRDCAQRCRVYHDTVWIRYEVSRRIRRATLHLLDREGMSPDDKNCAQRVRDMLLVPRGHGDARYGILDSLRRYVNGLIDQAEQFNARRVQRNVDGELALGTPDSEVGGGYGEDSEFRV